MSDNTFDIIVGSTNGSVKGVKIGRTKKENRIRNLQKLDRLTKDDQVLRIAWGDDDEQEILVACGSHTDRRVKVIDSESTAFKNLLDCNIGKGSIVGISRHDRSILTAVKSGEVCMWSGKKGEILLNAGDDLRQMRHSRERTNVIATGGQENRLKLYDLEKQQMIFSTKNLPHDWLNLRRPISISDLNFLPGSEQLATVGRDGHIHLYDPRSQRRPVIDMMRQDEAWTCLAIPPKEKHIIVGSTKGHLNLVDLRKPGTLLNTYKGFIGGVTGVTCSRTNPYVASVSLDRHLRIHDINTKKVLKCIYLTSRLSCLVMKSDVEIEYEDDTETYINKIS